MSMSLILVALSVFLTTFTYKLGSQGHQLIPAYLQVGNYSMAIVTLFGSNNHKICPVKSIVFYEVHVVYDLINMMKYIIIYIYKILSLYRMFKGFSFLYSKHIQI